MDPAEVILQRPCVETLPFPGEKMIKKDVGHDRAITPEVLPHQCADLPKDGVFIGKAIDLAVKQDTLLNAFVKL